eukprot:Skav232488  [mRNA]  locus=scaffold2877:344557:345696:- [translate_table: standard]
MHPSPRGISSAPKLRWWLSVSQTRALRATTCIWFQGSQGNPLDETALKRKKGQISSDSDSEQVPVQPLKDLAATAAELQGPALVSRFLSFARAEWQQLKPKADVLEQLQATDPVLEGIHGGYCQP